MSEALTNAIKHSRASVITIEIESTETKLRATVQDDGVGGAVVGVGTGLSGLIDRLDALGGTVAVSSPDRGWNACRDHAAVRPVGFLNASCRAVRR